MKLIKLPSGDWIRPDLVAAIMSSDGPPTIILILVSHDFHERAVIHCGSVAERNKLAFQIAEACNA